METLIERYSGPIHDPSSLTGNNDSFTNKVYPDMIHLVDVYWYQFPPLDARWHKVLGITIAILGLMSFIGNSLVIYIFTTTKSLRTPSNIFIINLAFSDMAMMLTKCPPMAYNCYMETWALGPVACEVYGMTGSLFADVSIWTMVLIAMDRYNVIVKGLPGKQLTFVGAMTKLLVIWIHGLIWVVLPMVGWNRYVPEGNMTVCGVDYLSRSWFSRSYILLYSVAMYHTPLVVITYCYIYIIKVVAVHEKNMENQAKRMNIASFRCSQTTRPNTTRVEIKLARVALMTISLWFMAWTPYLVINYIGLFQLFDIGPLFTIWGSVFAKANSVYNPIVYAISHPKYRAALRARWPFVYRWSSYKSEVESTGTKSADISD